jgi:hypothetical protein
MKTSTLISTFAMAFLMLISVHSNAQNFPELDKSPMDASAFPSNYDESKKLIKIVYSRPQLNDRSLKDLLPKGSVWRTGANEAAELTLYVPMRFGETELEPGTYTFFVIPQGDEWAAVINKDLNIWGTYSYNEENDIAKVVVPVKIDKKNSLEAFSIVFEEAKKGIIYMNLGWEYTRVAFPFKTL